MKTILMHTRVQPDILGGVIARVGDRVIDGSIRHRLTALQHQLLTGVAVASNDGRFALANEEQIATDTDTEQTRPAYRSPG